jgi:hypothetical protein
VPPKIRELIADLVAAASRIEEVVQKMKDSARYAKVVEDAIETYRREGRPLPPATSGRDFANKMQHVA